MQWSLGYGIGENMSQIIGMNNLLRKLEMLGANISNVMYGIIENEGKFVEDEARLNCPVDTGDLRQSIQHSTEKNSDGVTSTIYTNSDHGAYVEFGTGMKGEETNRNPNVSVGFNQDWSGMAAQPYLYPALKNNEDKIKKHAVGELKKEIERIAR